MRITPILAASFALSAFLFVSSITCLILQPDLEWLTPIWEACLIIGPLLILVSYLISKAVSLKTAPFLVLDILICAGIFFLAYSGALHPGFVIHRPFGVGASFDYAFIFPLLVFFASSAVH